MAGAYANHELYYELRSARTACHSTRIASVKTLRRNDENLPLSPLEKRDGKRRIAAMRPYTHTNVCHCNPVEKRGSNLPSFGDCFVALLLAMTDGSVNSSSCARCGYGIPGSAPAVRTHRSASIPHFRSIFGALVVPPAI